LTKVESDFLSKIQLRGFTSANQFVRGWSAKRSASFPNIGAGAAGRRQAFAKSCCALQTGGPAATVDRLFSSQHVKDLQLIVAVAFMADVLFSSLAFRFLSKTS
jgi:hypothetical protein